MTDFYEEAIAAFRSGDNERTRKVSEQALSAARAARDVATEVDALCMLSRVALRDGDYVLVRSVAEQARSAARAAGEERLERMPLHIQAAAARMSGDSAFARRLYEESIALNRRLGEERMVAAEQHNLTYVELHDGKTPRAKTLFAQALAEARRLGYEGLLPYLVGDSAVIAAEEDNAERAARLAGAAHSAFVAAGQIPDPDDAAEQERLLAKLAGRLGEDRMRALYEEGERLTINEALDL